jgi:RES domain-containing protein
METVTFWRLVKERYALTAFDGYGARTFGGRWNSPGHECVYLGESKASACWKRWYILRLKISQRATVFNPRCTA